MQVGQKITYQTIEANKLWTVTATVTRVYDGAVAAQPDNNGPESLVRNDQINTEAELSPTQVVHQLQKSANSSAAFDETSALQQLKFHKIASGEGVENRCGECDALCSGSKCDSCRDREQYAPAF